jgi:hypothetical protein
MRFSVASLFGVLTIAAICFAIWRRDAVLALVAISTMAAIWRVTKLELSEKITLIRAILSGGVSALLALLGAAYVPMLAYVGYQLLAGTWSTNYPNTSPIQLLTAFVVLYGGGSIVVGMAAGLVAHATLAKLITPQSKSTQADTETESVDAAEREIV